MERLSAGAMDCIDRLMGGPADGDHEAFTLGPQFVLIESPMEDAEEVLASAWEGQDKAIRQANRRLQRRDPSEAGIDSQGRYTLGGRACCYELATRVLEAIHRVPAGSIHTCPSCGSQWRIEMGATRGAA